VEYLSEIGLHDQVTITFSVLAMSVDGSRFVVENEIWSPRESRAAVVRSTGGWLDLRARRLVAPPAALLSALMQIPRSAEFVELKPVGERRSSSK